MSTWDNHGDMFRRYSQPLLAPLAIALANEGTAVLGLDNEMAVGADGWVRIAPFGDSTKVRRVRTAAGAEETQSFVQRLTPAAAQAMVDDSRRITSKVGRMLRFQRGIPIFRRHPDLSKHSPETVTLENQGDAYPRGYFSELAVRDDGFWGRVVLGDEGEDVIANEGLKYLSPLWLVRPIGQEGDSKVVEPFKLLSAGLTDRPNIPGGDPLANQKDPAAVFSNTNMNRQQLLAALGLTEAATDADITAKITTLSSSASQVATLSNEKTTLATAKTTAETALANEQAAHTATRQAFQKERGERIKLIVDGAVAASKITAAERPAIEAALANEATFEAEVAKLATRTPVLPNGSQTQNAGGRRDANGTDASQQLIILANEKLAECGNDWPKAYLRAKSLRPDLAKAIEVEEQARRTASASAK